MDVCFQASIRGTHTRHSAHLMIQNVPKQRKCLSKELDSENCLNARRFHHWQIDGAGIEQTKFGMRAQMLHNRVA
jgi:hypothetical protein